MKPPKLIHSTRGRIPAKSLHTATNPDVRVGKLILKIIVCVCARALYPLIKPSTELVKIWYFCGVCVVV